MIPRYVSREELEHRRDELTRILEILVTYDEAGVRDELRTIAWMLNEPEVRAHP